MPILTRSRLFMTHRSSENPVARCNPGIYEASEEVERQRFIERAPRWVDESKPAQRVLCLGLTKNA